MLKFILTILFLKLVISGSSQDTTLTYFNDNWKETTKEEAFYFRKFFKEGQKFKVIDYFITGEEQMIGYFKSKKGKKEHGSFTYYYKNGNVKSFGDYTKGKQIGTWTWNYESGNISEEGTFNKKEIKIGEWKNWYDGSGLDNKGSFIKGKKSGEWKWFFQNGQLS